MCKETAEAIFCLRCQVAPPVSRTVCVACSVNDKCGVDNDGVATKYAGMWRAQVTLEATAYGLLATVVPILIDMKLLWRQSSWPLMCFTAMLMLFLLPGEPSKSCVSAHLLLTSPLPSSVVSATAASTFGLLAT